MALKLSRRTFVAGSLGASVAPWLSRIAQAEQITRGGILTVALWPAPTYLNSAVSAGGIESIIGPKLSDGLLTYDYDMTPRPQLAESWSVSEDGLRVTFKLRSGVKWHDGAEFTSRDVAFTMMEVWKVFHGRGRTTFANITGVETPDPLTAVFVLSKPAPAAMKSLASMEAQVLPAHLYEGTDILQNPYNTAPVGNGPYRFVSFEKGDNAVFERNPDYWDEDLPRLDRLVFRFIPDAATRTAMLESGEVQLIPYSMLPGPDISRLADDPNFVVDTRGYEYVAGMQHLEFNLDHPILGDQRVRAALAHAMDRDWIARNIWYGRASRATGPIHPSQVDAYSTDGVPDYPFDPAKAEALLDEAGYPRQAGGVRFSVTIDPSPYGPDMFRTAEYLKEAFRQVGVDLTIRNQDMASYLKRIYTDRDFDMLTNVANCAADPTIGVQRFYWSKNFQKGVVFSNATNYNNPEVDQLLEAAQTENDPAARREQFLRFQQIVLSDLPAVPLVYIDFATLTPKGVHEHTLGATGIYGNFARTWIEA